MFGSTILDVAIGLIFSFLAISLFTSATVEAINSLLQLRAVNLKSGIMALVNDPGFAGLAKGLYEHPLVSPLGPGVQQAPAAGAAAQAPIRGSTSHGQQHLCLARQRCRDVLAARRTTVCRYQNSPGLHRPVAVCARSARRDPALRGVGGGCRGCAARRAAGARLTRRRDHRNRQSANPRFHQRRIRSDPGRHQGDRERSRGLVRRRHGPAKRRVQTLDAGRYLRRRARSGGASSISIRSASGARCGSIPPSPTSFSAAEQPTPQSGTVPQSAPAQSPDFRVAEKQALENIQALLDAGLPIGWPSGHLFDVSDGQSVPTYIWTSRTFGQSLVGWLITAFATLFGAHSGSTLCSRSFASKERVPVRTRRRRSERPQARGFARRN